jgi:2-dehydro-3-deoxyphosphogluconate aldolase/(4S)-4-hydroxy-2-oxoglutarate aldolase
MPADADDRGLTCLSQGAQFAPRGQAGLSPGFRWAANRDMLAFYFSNRIQERYMARFARLKVLNTMIDTGLVPVFYHPDLEVARQVAAACLAGGCRLLEFTNRGDHAWEVFNELEKYCARELPDMILGVGSVVDPGTASLYINCGANFVVGPVLNPDVARTCNRRKIPYSPGCGSASEISQAEELGCEIVKVFPGKEVGGPAFVKSVKGPCPWVSIMPTGGVEATEASLKSWFGAGVSCVGMGSNLVSGELLKAGDYAGIAANVRAALDLIRSIRGGK